MMPSATEVNTNAFEVKSAGMLTLIMDSGRFGQSHLGLTHGGPADKEAFMWANRLLDNDANATMLEVTIGGLQLLANIDTYVCITGAEMSFSINGKPKGNWQTHKVKVGDLLEFGYAKSGIKAYFAVAGGFQVSEQFGSTTTVVREKIGGLSGEGLKANDKLSAFNSVKTFSHQKQLMLAAQPNYTNDVLLRVVLGYQQASFSRVQKVKFFNGKYHVSKQWDRMGYRLEGDAISCSQTAMLSEGIALGAIQIPPDGQPIILMNDRQTIGGYPKIGSVLSLDLHKLAQCGQGAEVRFEEITIDDAHNAIQLAQYRFKHAKTIESAW